MVTRLCTGIFLIVCFTHLTTSNLIARETASIDAMITKIREIARDLPIDKQKVVISRLIRDFYVEDRLAIESEGLSSTSAALRALRIYASLYQLAVDYPVEIHEISGDVEWPVSPLEIADHFGAFAQQILAQKSNLHLSLRDLRQVAADNETGLQPFLRAALEPRSTDHRLQVAIKLLDKFYKESFKQYEEQHRKAMFFLTWKDVDSLAQARHRITQYLSATQPRENDVLNFGQAAAVMSERFRDEHRLEWLVDQLKALDSDRQIRFSAALVSYGVTSEARLKAHFSLDAPLAQGSSLRSAIAQLDGERQSRASTAAELEAVKLASIRNLVFYCVQEPMSD